MDYWLYIPIIFILIFSIWFWLARTKKTTSSHKTTTPSGSIPKTYPGVSIMTHLNACGPVSIFKGKRLLADEAPALPVFGCTAKACSCRYVRHKDRRSGEDRRYPNASVAWESANANSDKRSRRDRRQPAQRPSFA